MEISRRGFLASGAAFLISATLPMAAFGRLLEYGNSHTSIPRDFGCSCDFCKCLAVDLYSRPESSVAHTVCRVEHLKSQMSFGELIRGLSVHKHGEFAKRWAFLVDIENHKDPVLPVDMQYIRQFANDMCETLNKAWINSKFGPRWYA